MKFFNTIAIVGSSIQQAVGALRTNKLRTFLSLLGVTIGIFCIVAISTVLSSLENYSKQSFSSLGSDILYVSRWPWMDEGGEYKWWDFAKRPRVTIDDYRAIEKNKLIIDQASMMDKLRAPIVKHSKHEATDIEIIGVTEGFEQLQNIDIGLGSYLSSQAINNSQLHAVIGESINNLLFPENPNSIGKKITFSGKHFTVVGIIPKKGFNASGLSYDNSIIIPYKVLTGIRKSQNIGDATLLIKSKPNIPIEEVKAEAEGILRAERKLGPEESNTFSINTLSQLIERINSIFMTIDMVGWIIGGFSLLVGGFGIANIMFVSVKERTKYIGLKKAIGAPSYAILSEFLFEAVVLSLLGGIIGIAFVSLLAFIANSYIDFKIVITFKILLNGLTISTLVGIISGLIPALSAAKMNPVTAIRTN